MALQMVRGFLLFSLFLLSIWINRIEEYSSFYMGSMVPTMIPEFKDPPLSIGKHPA